METAWSECAYMALGEAESLEAGLWRDQEMGMGLHTGIGWKAGILEEAQSLDARQTAAKGSYTCIYMYIHVCVCVCVCVCVRACVCVCV